MDTLVWIRLDSNLEWPVRHQPMIDQFYLIWSLSLNTYYSRRAAQDDIVCRYLFLCCHFPADKYIITHLCILTLHKRSFFFFSFEVNDFFVAGLSWINFALLARLWNIFKFSAHFSIISGRLKSVDLFLCQEYGATNFSSHEQMAQVRRFSRKTKYWSLMLATHK